MSVKKVFGIISYFPDNDSDYHIETRRERSRRFRELLFKLEELWPDVDIMIIAQNWQDFELPSIKNKITAYHYGKLGILGARRELRKRFLGSSYDYLIMLDDDAIISTDNPQAYMDEIDKHPDGIGAIRKNKSPLQLLAISNAIYSKIDMPNIDAEKGEGFEDDIFVASCFAKFPDVAFMFPEGIVTEISFRYEAEGKCQSTWAKEHNYDWKYMRSHTKSVIAAIKQDAIQQVVAATTPAVTPTIDLIVTYVNGSDLTWIRTFIKATKTHNPSSIRFRSWGTLKYLLRGVERYMPFIRQVILVVAGESQVPVWVNQENVRVVYHRDFIPSELLPTFNSCTIESFFWRIPDLADRVIYFNDDMFPIAPMCEETFFTGNMPHIKFTAMEHYSNKNIFRSQCRSGIDLVTDALGLPALEPGVIFRPYHISAPLVKSTMTKIGEMCGDKLVKVASVLRRGTNVNQYIYSYYQYYTNDYVNKVVHYKYFEVSDQTLPDIVKEVSGESYQMVCLNDSDKIKNYNQARYKLQTCFESKFPKKSKYEI